MSETRYDPTSWHDAGLEVWALWDQYRAAMTPLDAADLLVRLNNAMSDFASWLPGYDGDRGIVTDPRWDDQ